jgi:hypothetical protein
MKKHLPILGSLALLVAGLPMSAVAAPQFIKCPVEKVRTEITTPLPSGWWQTPQVGSLTGTRIGTVGGQKTLMCDYWAYGDSVAVMHKAPAGKTCRAVSGGFRCEDSRPVTHRTGRLVIDQTWMADLDAGVVGGPRNQADIWFEADTATRRYITPRNGAKIAIAGTRSIGKSGCSALSLSSNRISVSRTPVGTYVCVKTNRGRMSQFRVNEPIGPSPGKLTIGYTTWKH